MKKGYVAVFLAVVAITAFSISYFATSEPKITENGANLAVKTDVVTVSQNSKKSLDSEKVLETRFLNMLNHNFVYDTAFDSVEDIVNCSMPALLEHRDSENDSIIAQTYVNDYISNMYGITDIDYTEINREFECSEGYVYILPCGFTKYSHEIVSLTANEDGSYTVKTKITAGAHDATDFTDTCTTLFVPNANSAFGYNIIYSNIGGTALSI